MMSVRRATSMVAGAAVVAAMSVLGGPAPAAPPSSGGVGGPLDAGAYALTSYLGPRCLPVIHASTFHGGQDLSAADGADLFAIADGRVVRAQADPVAGQWLLIEHVIGGQRVQASYSHMRDADRFVRVGQTVRRGQKVAEVGSTGVSTAPHLHLEIWLGSYLSGTRVDPLTWFRSKGVDLGAAAVRAIPRSTPATCTYYAVGTTRVHASPSAGSPVVATVPAQTTMTSAPGTKQGGFIPVRAAGRSGWAHENNVSPTKIGVPVARTTAQVPLRQSPGAGSPTITTLPQGAALDDVTALSHGWYQVEAGPDVGWVPVEAVRLEEGRFPGVSYGFFLANTFTTTAETVFDYGDDFDEFFVGDWDGDGTDTLAYRRGNAFHLRAENGPGSPDRVVYYGRPGDVVLVGDWDGDGVDTLAVRRGNLYHVKNSVSSGPADAVVAYGRAGDTALVGDFDGDGDDTLAVRRAAYYYVKNTLSAGAADRVVVYGRPGDAVLVGDWDGDGADTFAVRRGNDYHIKNTIASGVADVRVFYGRATDEVYVGDWDGNASDTLGVYRFH